jgi:hypothetical protein
MRIDLTGDYQITIYEAARRLLADGAEPAETIETYRNGVLSMSGLIGVLSKWTVAENPSLRMIRWHPFPYDAVRARTAEKGEYLEGLP